MLCLNVFNTWTLTVKKAGSGNGTVTSIDGKINCGTDCSEMYVQETMVSLTPAPASGSTFAGWSGDADCSDGQVTIEAEKTCIATFTIAPLSPPQLTLAPTGPLTISPGYPMGFSLTLNNQGDPLPVRLQLLLLPEFLGRELSLVGPVEVTLPSGTVGPIPFSPALPRDIQSLFPGDYSFIGRLLDKSGDLLSEGRTIFTVPARVSIEDYRFNPQFIVVRTGESVQWTNHGAVTHTTTSTTGVWDSGDLAPGSSFSHPFTNADPYPYYCQAHSEMTGGVKVLSGPLQAGPERTKVERRLKKGLKTDKLKKAIQKGLRP